MKCRERLLALHLFFDLTWREWLNFLALEQSQGPIDPFTQNTFRKFIGTAHPRCWDEALELSAQFKERRISRYDANFPAALVERGLEVPVIYVKGQTDVPEAAALFSVVGTRSVSQLGRETAYQFTQHFAKAGFGIISGLALGVDSLAHHAALEAGAFTAAVIGSPLDQLYPRENMGLAEKILSRAGLILSEFPPGTKTQQYFFPRRNALIAALSAGVFVAEAPPKSGAQITAKLALSYGIPVCTPPREYTHQAGLGALKLVHAGAWPIASPAEALESFYTGNGGILRPMQKPPPKVGARQFSLADFCSSQGMELPRGVAKLEEQLISGSIERLGPDRFRRRRFAQR